MPFTDGNDRPAIRRYASIGITRSRGCSCRRRYWPSVGTRILSIETLVREVGEKNRVVMQEICAAAIFMHTCSSVKAGNRIRGLAVEFCRDNNDAAFFLRTAFKPVHFAIGKFGLAEPDSSGRQK